MVYVLSMIAYTRIVIMFEDLNLGVLFCILCINDYEHSLFPVFSTMTLVFTHCGFVFQDHRSCIYAQNISSYAEKTLGRLNYSTLGYLHLLQTRS